MRAKKLLGAWVVFALSLAAGCRQIDAPLSTQFSLCDALAAYSVGIVGSVVSVAPAPAQSHDEYPGTPKNLVRFAPDRFIQGGDSLSLAGDGTFTALVSDSEDSRLRFTSEAALRVYWFWRMAGPLYTCVACTMDPDDAGDGWIAADSSSPRTTIASENLFPSDGGTPGASCPRLDAGSEETTGDAGSP